MKKKIMSLMLAFVLALSMCTVAFAAEEEPTDQASFTFTKNFDIVGQGVTSDETFSFTAPVCTDVTDAAAGVTAESENARENGLPTVSEVSFKTALIPQKGTVTVTLPEYTSVGIYTYSFKEEKGDTAGVTYDETTYTFTVSVFNGEDNTFVRVPSMMIKNDKGDKVDSITNVYTANSLSVKKIVKGKLGDKSREFTVKVKFTAPQGTVVKQSIWAGTSEKTEIIKADDWTDGTAEATISLKNEQTVIFYNIPAGVTYEVTEDDYTGEGYTTTYENQSGTMGAEAISTVITNTKDGGEIETGINLDSVPYILMMVVVCAGVFVLFSKKRMARED